MNQIIASLRNQVQKIKCRIANLTNRVTYIENNCCNGGGETEIPDWQNQAYSQGSIVAHNGGIWRSEIEGNEDEPIVCEGGESSWEEIPAFVVDRMIIHNDFEDYYNVSYQSFFNGATKEYFSSYFENLNLTINVGDLIFLDTGFGKPPVICEVIEDVVETDNIPNLLNKINVQYVTLPFIVPGPMITCDYLLNIGNRFGLEDVVYYIDSDGISPFKLISCPITDFVVESCSWTLLAQVNEGGESSNLTLEQARQNGNVLEGDVEFSDGGMNVTTINSTGLSNSGWRFGTGIDKDGLVFSNITEVSGTTSLSFMVSNSSMYDSKGIIGNEEFDKQGDRKAFAQIADVEDFYTTITGYDAGETQTLKNVNGVLTWITD